jgi:aldehyde:ferredoxin oxidoreductase
MNGFFNTILTINCTDTTYSTELLEDSVLERYLGGKGLGGYLLLNRNPAGVDPLSPDNKLIFTTGPAAGLQIWGANRYACFTKSPLTGLFSESYSGGKAFLQIARLGYDAIIIEGQCPQWSYVEITSEGIQFHECSSLIGKDSFETETILKEKHKKQKPAVLTIGPAGENLIRYAYVNNDHGRCLGRTGVGAVLGAKKIKALVFSGEKKKSPFDSEQLKQFQKELLTAGKEHPGVAAYKAKGTSLVVDLTTKAEAFPARYWQQGTVEHAHKINAEALHSSCDVKATSCLYCFIACTRHTTIKDGRHAGLSLDGPEYETINAFGGLTMVDDIREIAYLNDICDRLGLDTITAGNVVAFAIEAYKQGKIDFAIDYNDVDRITELLHHIAYREGIGNLLAEGVRKAAQELGMENIAIHVKGLEPPGYDPRSLHGMGLGYAVSDRGACHLRATFYKPELAGLIDPRKNDGKAKMYTEYEDRLTIYDTLILCRFFRDLIFWDELSTIIASVTGKEWDSEYLRRIAVNVTNTTRQFNLQEGLTPHDDFLPDFFFIHPIGKERRVLDRDSFKSLVDDYYKIRGF